MVPSLSPSPLLKPSSICCEFICLLHMLSVHIIQYVPPNIKTQTYNCLNKPKALHSKLTAPSPNPASPCFLSSSCPSPGNISKSNKLGPQIWIPQNSQTINQSLTSSSLLNQTLTSKTRTSVVYCRAPPGPLASHYLFKKCRTETIFRKVAIELRTVKLCRQTSSHYLVAYSTNSTHMHQSRPSSSRASQPFPCIVHIRVLLLLSSIQNVRLRSSRAFFRFDGLGFTN
jgi:hypothetical protein